MHISIWAIMIAFVAIGLICWGVSLIVQNTPGIPGWVKGIIIGFLVLAVGLFLLQGHGIGGFSLN